MPSCHRKSANDRSLSVDAAGLRSRPETRQRMASTENIAVGTSAILFERDPFLLARGAHALDSRR